ncbi:MAG: hypothetical protein L6R43_18575 [Planctomycetes bacterium]|nr:hypothetical protein [Planctomycetota bacterium]
MSTRTARYERHLALPFHVEARAEAPRGRAQGGAWRAGFAAGHHRLIPQGLLFGEAPVPRNPYAARAEERTADGKNPTWARGLFNAWAAGFKAGETCAARELGR